MIGAMIFASAYDELSATFGGAWPAIRRAREESDERKRDLQTLLGRDAGQLRPDMNFVVFGSLARGEWTSQSDVDWSLVVDGQADPMDIHTAKRVERTLIDGNWNKPGPSGIFGSLSFSHSLVHEIGGTADNHINITRRVLLLLESVAIGDKSIRDRVVRAILARYLEEDTHFHPYQGSRSFVPRFLLNDLVRYWRTVAVDYANKTREHDRNKWALRNIKLRMSRKILFVKGLLMCLLCHLEQANIPGDYDMFGGTKRTNVRFINFLTQMIDNSPINVICDVIAKRNISKETTNLILDSYDAFLSTLNNAELRKHLDNLTYEEAKEDSEFEKMRGNSRHFQEGLRKLFFEEDKEITKLCQIYALF